MKIIFNTGTLIFDTKNIKQKTKRGNNYSGSRNSEASSFDISETSSLEIEIVKLKAENKILREMIAKLS